MSQNPLWKRYKKYLHVNPDLGLSVDISRMDFTEEYLDRMKPRMQRAFREMETLESGAIANPDEARMVGHYWLRAPRLSPTPEIRREIEKTLRATKNFARDIHSGKILSPCGRRFSRILVIGIGGSALGPQFVSHALGSPKDPIKPYFFDNTDPDGMDRVLEEIGEGLAETLILVISKSGETKETRNGMLEAEAALRARNLPFEKQVLAITEAGSELDRLAKEKKWLARFPMWNWVGGRTSETSVVGLLPAALHGIDIDSLLTGARLCDEATREKKIQSNPAALLSLMWYHATGGCGKKDMVILPYKDRLQLFPKYLQQLVMESLGKEKDLRGKTVNQGITVYGNKGSTDQHAYIQQLRDGVHNFFITFIEVLQDRKGKSRLVGEEATSGDYLSSYFLGTRQALFEKGRESITITIEQVDARSIGTLIALYERAVGLYASLIQVNAYHQPGVESGKRMAQTIIRLQTRIFDFLRKERGKSFTPEEVAFLVRAEDEVESVFKVLEHAAANEDRRIKKIPASSPFEARYQYVHGQEDETGLTG